MKNTNATKAQTNAAIAVSEVVLSNDQSRHLSASIDAFVKAGMYSENAKRELIACMTKTPDYATYNKARGMAMDMFAAKEMSADAAKMAWSRLLKASEVAIPKAPGTKNEAKRAAYVASKAEADAKAEANLKAARALKARVDAMTIEEKVEAIIVDPAGAQALAGAMLTIKKAEEAEAKASTATTKAKRAKLDDLLKDLSNLDFALDCFARKAEVLAVLSTPKVTTGPKSKPTARPVMAKKTA